MSNAVGMTTSLVVRPEIRYAQIETYARRTRLCVGDVDEVGVRRRRPGSALLVFTRDENARRLITRRSSRVQSRRPPRGSDWGVPKVVTETTGRFLICEAENLEIRVRVF